MPRKKNRPNPFDELCKRLDPQASFDKNAKLMYDLLVKGEFDLHVAAEILVEASVMPNLARENHKLCAAVKDLMHKLDIANDSLRDLSEQQKEMAIASQDGITIEDERRAMKSWKFPKGPKVN